MNKKKYSLKRTVKGGLRVFFAIIKYKSSKFGIQISRNISKNEVVKLIKSLQPYKTQFNLIRMGSDIDGGYLIPDDLQGIKTCFSPGVDTESSFEIDCLNRGMQVFLADNSVEKPNIDSSIYNYNFIKKHIGTVNNEDFITFTKWVSDSEVNKKEDLLLQMDIEGSEYNAFMTIDEELLKRFRIILVEFHFLDKLWNKNFFVLADAVFNKILSSHTCVHIHPNNCSGIHKYKGVEIPVVLEFSFLRNDRITNKKKQSQFPHKLDIDNLREKAPVLLPKIWYSN